MQGEVSVLAYKQSTEMAKEDVNFLGRGVCLSLEGTKGNER